MNDDIYRWIYKVLEDEMYDRMVMRYDEVSWICILNNVLAVYKWCLMFMLILLYL
jgi:hypothetical protein